MNGKNNVLGLPEFGGLCVRASVGDFRRLNGVQHGPFGLEMDSAELRF